MENYIISSLETHLFFARIMKEHALFLQAGFPCKDEAWIQKSDWFRTKFEELLHDTVKLADHRVGSCILDSNEVTTDFTLSAEKRTEALSGIPIDTHITRMEEKLCPGTDIQLNRRLLSQVNELNSRSIQLLNGLIQFKENILKAVTSCSLFTTNYPTLIRHILREAQLYRSTILNLTNNRRTAGRSSAATEDFWNQIMMEHALFIRGLLDPCEEELICTANDLAKAFQQLLDASDNPDCGCSEDTTEKSLKEAMKIREFKAAGAEGILDCKIESIILPLLADHVLREANHYIRLLSCH